MINPFAGDPIMQGVERKGGKQYKQFSSKEQAQYLTKDHPAAARFSHLIHRLQNPQLVLLLL